MFTFLKKKKVVEPLNIEEDIIFQYANIIKLLNPGKDPAKQRNFKIYHKENDISFEYNSNLRDEVEKLIPMETLELVVACFDGNNDFWEASYEEYLRMYKNNETVKKVEELLKTHSLLNKYKEDKFYHLIIAKFELSISTVYNTLKESQELNNTIPENLKKSTVEILSKFSTAISECEKERVSFKEKELFVYNKSLDARLELELDYMDKFIENNK
jgi:hypothetical protein